MEKASGGRFSRVTRKTDEDEDDWGAKHLRYLRPPGRVLTGAYRPKARKKQNFLGDLSNSGPAVRLYREGRATGPPEDRYERMEKL